MRMVVRYIVTNIHVGNREFKMKLHQTIQEKRGSPVFKFI